MASLHNALLTLSADISKLTEIANRAAYLDELTKGTSYATILGQEIEQATRGSKAAIEAEKKEMEEINKRIEEIKKKLNLS